MLILFRSIRQKLILEENVKKYLLYAIGEILLVVIGILIALQINTWNQQRIQKAAELQYLQNLLIDVDLQIDEFTRAMIAESRVGRSMLLAGKWLESGLHVSDPHHLDSLLSYTISNRSVNIFDATFEDLKSTGNIRILSNDDLKREILLFYQSIARADRVLQKNELTKASIRESIIENSFASFQVDYEIGLTDLLETSGFPAVNPIPDHNNQFNFNRSVLKNIRSEQGILKLNNIITSRYFSVLVSVATIQQVNESAGQLRMSIEAELNRKTP